MSLPFYMMTSNKNRARSALFYPRQWMCSIPWVLAFVCPLSLIMPLSWLSTTLYSDQTQHNSRYVFSNVTGFSGDRISACPSISTHIFTSAYGTSEGVWSLAIKMLNKSAFCAVLISYPYILMIVGMETAHPEAQSPFSLFGVQWQHSADAAVASCTLCLVFPSYCVIDTLV